MQPIKIVFIKTDTYLDISYYDIKIKYWDGEIVLKNNMSSFKFGDVLLPILNNIDTMNLNHEIEIEISIENDNESKSKMKHLTDQVKLKQSKHAVRKQLTSSEKEAEKLKGLLNQYQILVY